VKLGFFADECLKVNLITSSADGPELVSSGAAQVGGSGSAADFLEAAGNGANVEAVSTFGDTSPYTLLTQKSITNLTQLEGKTFGYHTTIPVILLEELKKAGVDSSKVDFVNDTSYNPDLLPEGKFAAIQAYTDNEPLTLKSQNLPFRQWNPSLFGIKGTYDPEFVNKTWAGRYPTAVADFERADLYALTYCYAHSVQCVNIEAAYATSAGSSFPLPHKLQQFNLAAQVVKTSSLPGLGIGVETYAEWMPEYNALKAFGIVKTLPPLKDVENTTIVASLYDGTKLIWPGP
jgi:NitT/TauT family transport system substrate-binding protein